VLAVLRPSHLGFDELPHSGQISGSHPALRPLLPMVKGAIYSRQIVLRTDAEYSVVRDIRVYNTFLRRVFNPHARPR
jgi:hypothetical protein